MLVSAKAVAALCVLHCLTSVLSTESSTTSVPPKEVTKTWTTVPPKEVTKTWTTVPPKEVTKTWTTVPPKEVITAQTSVPPKEVTKVSTDVAKTVASTIGSVNTTVHANDTANTTINHSDNSHSTTTYDLHLNRTQTSDGSTSHLMVITTASPDDSNTTECLRKLQMLAVLPGQGWDNLESVSKGQIFMKNYSMCTVTADGTLVIPDGMLSAPLFESTIDPTTEIFTKWEDYYPILAKTVTKDATNPNYAAVSGSFSESYQHIKKIQVTQKAVTVRVQLKSKLYEIVMSNDKVQLTDDFLAAMTKLENAVYDSDEGLMHYYSDAIIHQFGTHSINGITAGGMVAVEESVKADFLDVTEALDFSKLSTLAKINFLQHFNMTAAEHKVDPATEKLLKKYIKSRIDTQATVYGGDVERPFEYNHWLKSLHSSPSTLDRTGIFLDEVVIEENFPHIPPPFVYQMKEEIKNAISRYYTRNTHPGCMNQDAPNFSYLANKEDGTCLIPSTNYTFGGVFQKCKQSSDKLGDFCRDLKLELKNPLTGDFSCPNGYKKIPLHSHTLREDNCPTDCLNNIKCTEKCTKEKFQMIDVTYHTYWCAAEDNLPANSGCLFGGIYSSKAVNMVTGRYDCPSLYNEFKITEDLNVCISTDFNPEALKESVLFGGLFSCTQGNPLLLPLDQRKHSDSAEWPMRCPLDYSRYTATIDGTCAISYCTSTGNLNTTVLPLISPPYTAKPIATNIHVLVFRDGNNGDVWFRKNETESWKKATTEQDLKDAGLEGLLSMLTTETTTSGEATKAMHIKTVKHNNTKNDGLGGGVIAAIVIVGTLGVLAVVGLAGYAYKKKKDQRERSDSKAQLTRNDSVQQERSDSIASQPHQSTHGSFDSPA